MTPFMDHYELALADVAAGQRVPIPLFPIGDWKSAKYPSLPLGRDLADELIAGFDAGLLGTEPVLDSSGNHDTSAPAAGWFKRLYVAPTKDGGEMLFGDAELTDLGAAMLNDGLYKYDSIEIGPVVDNATGEKTDNVFRSATLTNTPVLRMLPPVLDAADMMLAEPVEIALSEVTLADGSDPVAAAVTKLDEALAAVNEALHGKLGVPAIRTMIRAAIEKASAHTLTEDDGNPVELSDGSSEPVSQPAKGDEGHDVTLAEGDAAQKGSDPMKSVALKLNLAEDADEATILAEVEKLAQAKDAAETEAAAVRKEARDAEVERTLSELVNGGHVAPAKKDELQKLADESPAGFAMTVALLRDVKAIDLDEHGTHEGGGEDGADPAADLTRRAVALAEQKGIDLAEAMSIEITNTPGLAEQRLAELAQRIQTS